jgi:hypothetical protein
MPGELLAGVRVAGVEDGTQLRAGHLTRQPELLGAVAEPAAGFLPAGEVVALDPILTAGDGGEVVVSPPRAPSARCSATVAELLH